MGTLGRKATGPDFERFRAALALKESSGNPSAVQWDTKARGLFQFIPRWHEKWVKEELGRSIDDFMPKDNSQAEMERATRAQMEELFPRYYERELAPFVAKMRKTGLGKDYADEDLAAMAHFAGSGGAEKFLKTGVDITKGTAGNAGVGIPEYVQQLRKHLSKNPEESLKARAASSKHYGEYGLGRGVYDAYRSRDIAKTDDVSRRQAQKAVYGKSSPVIVASRDQPAVIAPEKKKSPLVSQPNSPGSTTEPSNQQSQKIKPS